MFKKHITLVFMIFSMLMLGGCKDIQIFEEKAPDHAIEVSDRQLQLEVYYVKNGTKFSQVYLPLGNAKGTASSLDTSRLFYFFGDEAMVPVHYKGELVAYASATADLEKVVLERYKDMGFSLGIYGGKLEDDGLYHISVKNNVCPGSNAAEIFGKVLSDEIRIVSIGGTSIGEWIDEGSGVITGLEQDGGYLVEFYSGTYYYREVFKADTHFLRAFEVYRFDKDFINDTINGYMCFNTPEDLKSGYYNINGSGVFLYHAYTRGEQVENETFNEGYYENTAEMIAAYSKQYVVSVPYDTRDMKIVIDYGSIRDSIDMNSEITGYVVAPDGTGYEMKIDQQKKTLSLSMAVAMAGDWTVNISPMSLEVEDIFVENNDMMEDTVCEETEFTVPENTSFQMFYADIVGQGDVYGSIIAANGITYNFAIGQYKEGTNKGQRYMYYKLPYLEAGIYTVKIYHYQSQTRIENIQMVSYDDGDSEIIIIE